jgi:NADH:ubiquinone oxidoreductase subunit E
MTLEELRDVADQERERQSRVRHRVLYCAAAGCVSCGSHGTRDALKAAIAAQGIEGAEVVGTGAWGCAARARS